MGPPLISGGMLKSLEKRLAILRASMGPPLISGGMRLGGRGLRMSPATPLQWGRR